MTEINKKMILVVDDNKDIHNDFIKILSPNDEGDKKTKGQAPSYFVTSAYQEETALDLVREAHSNGKPYALAFVNFLIPPAGNGIQTIKEFWDIDPYLQIVVCSAHSEYPWRDIAKELGKYENFIILKKPFDTIEIRQLTESLTRKWQLQKEANLHVKSLEKLTVDLEYNLSLTRATLESTGEGTLIVNEKQEIISYNKIFLDFWGLTAEFMQKNDSYHIFQHMSKQVRDEGLFITIMSVIGSKPELERVLEWSLKSGKIVEIYRYSQKLKGDGIGTVCRFRDVTQQKELEKQLVFQATHDSLTGLPNRVLLADRVDQAIKKSKRYDMVFQFVLIDIDNFKQINDYEGHDIGDLILRSVTKSMKSIIREEDTVSRLGGDEFVVLFAPQVYEEDFDFMLEKLKKVFSLPFLINENEYKLTASMGVSIYPKDGNKYDTLMKNADIALYRAKDWGKNTIQKFSQEMTVDISRKTQLMESFHRAIERKEFYLQYQPLIDLKSNNIIGFEALIRWQHPKLGLIQPTEFIPLAEKNGSIIPIGEWVLKEACRQNKIWHDLGYPSLIMAVNVSIIQFQNQNFINTLKNALDESGLNPTRLELEMTENCILANSVEFVKKMFQIKELGVHLAIDDFGTGYSNLASLKHFPFDKIKIDKMFIDEISNTKSESSIMEAIITMSQKMGLTVLAEGVEQESQMDYLQKIHGDQMQGFYYSPPLNHEDCYKLLEKGMDERCLKGENKSQDIKKQGTINNLS